MSHKSWKGRLDDMGDALETIREYCKNFSSAEEFKRDRKTLDACLRNFQVLGDAAKNLPTQIQKELHNIPWNRIKGMRNILVHEYFGINSDIIWKTIDKDIPQLIKIVNEIRTRLEKPGHAWRICPPGEIFVKAASVQTHHRENSLVREHLRREHCREMQHTTKDVLSKSEIHQIADLFFEKARVIGASDLAFGIKGTKFDYMIEGWVQYWNEVFKIKPDLDPRIVKALIASESSFNENAGKSKRSSAKGLMQLMPSTIRYLNGDRNELKDYIFEFDHDESFDPNVNIAAGVRWLFRKKELASNRLRRESTWEEAIEEYKDYLRRRIANPKGKFKGMETFKTFLTQLKLQK